jgi:hypothetical protein
MKEEQSCAGDQRNSVVLIKQRCGTFRKSKHKGRVPALSITPVPLSQKPHDSRKNVWYTKYVHQSTLQLYPEKSFSNQYLTISGRDTRRKASWS